MKRIELLVDFTNWLIGVNWNFNKQGETRYLAIHFLCLHLCIFDYIFSDYTERIIE